MDVKLEFKSAGRALGEADAECPLCGPGFRGTLDIRAALQAGANEQVQYCAALNPKTYRLLWHPGHPGDGAEPEQRSRCGSIVGTHSRTLKPASRCLWLVPVRRLLLSMSMPVTDLSRVSLPHSQAADSAAGVKREAGSRSVADALQ